MTNVVPLFLSVLLFDLKGYFIGEPILSVLKYLLDIFIKSGIIHSVSLYLMVRVGQAVRSLIIVRGFILGR